MTKQSNTQDKLAVIVRALADKKGLNVLALDVEKESGFTDYMVFVTGTSTQHNRTLSDFTSRTIKTECQSKPLMEGEENAKWILIDSGDVIVHIMLEEVREHYDLEGFWNKSTRVDVKQFLK